MNEFLKSSEQRLDNELRLAEKKKSIFDIADRLSEKGIQPSATTIREKINGTSFSLINKYLKQWHQKRRSDQICFEKSKQESVSFPLPELLQKKIVSVSEQLWETAQQLMNDEIIQVKENFQKQLTALKSCLDEKQEMLQVVSSDLDAAVVKLDEFQNKSKIMDKSISDAREAGHKLKQTQRRCEHLERELTQTDSEKQQVKTRCEQHASNLKKVQCELTEEKNKQQEQQARSNRVEAENVLLKERVVMAQKKHKEQQLLHNSLTIELKKQLSDLSRKQTENRVLSNNVSRFKDKDSQSQP